MVQLGAQRTHDDIWMDDMILTSSLVVETNTEYFVFEYQVKIDIIYLLDYSSLYASIINNTDPSPVNSIEFIKSRLWVGKNNLSDRFYIFRKKS